MINFSCSMWEAFYTEPNVISAEKRPDPSRPPDGPTEVPPPPGEPGKTPPPIGDPVPPTIVKKYVVN